MVKEILGTSRLSYKFQVTVPKEVRERFELNAGDIVVFIDDNGALHLRKSTQS